ncbi:MAG: radical SAM protein [Candidatus Woesearchaeota archaeon]
MEDKLNTSLVAGWSFTKRCNLRCIHCYGSSGCRAPDELTLEEALNVADKLKTSCVEAVNFGGGECCLREDFIPLCERLHSLGIKISYTTNGTTLNRIRSHLYLFNDVGVSLDFPDAERHDYFRGGKGIFAKAVSSLQELVERGVDTEIVTCLTKMNCSEKDLSDMYQLAKEVGVDYWRLNRFRANGRGKENQSTLSLTPEDLRKAYTFLSQYVDNSVSVPEPIYRAAFGGKYTFPGDPSGYTAFRIQPNGEVSPSVFLTESGGNIKYNSLSEILGSPIFRSIRERNPQGKCQSCSAYSHCKGGDAGASYLEYGHFNGPDPLCWLSDNDIRGIVQQEISETWNVHERYLCTLYVPVRK